MSGKFEHLLAKAFAILSALFGTITSVLEWLLDKGVLLEVISLTLIAPLTAALVERRQRHRVRSLRRMAFVMLQRNCLHAAHSFGNAFIELTAALNSAKATERAEKSHKFLIENSRDRTGDPNNTYIFAEYLASLESSKRSFRGYLHRANSDFDRCIRYCQQFDQDALFAIGFLEPEEAIAVRKIQNPLFTVEEAADSYQKSIASLLRFEKPERARIAEFEILLDELENFTEKFGSFQPKEPWLIGFIVSVLGKMLETERQVDLDPEERQKVSDLVMKRGRDHIATPEAKQIRISKELRHFSALQTLRRRTEDIQALTSPSSDTIEDHLDHVKPGDKSEAGRNDSGA